MGQRQRHTDLTVPADQPQSVCAHCHMHSWSVLFLASSIVALPGGSESTQELSPCTVKAMCMQHSDLPAEERSALVAEFQRRIAEPEDGAAASVQDVPQGNLASEAQADSGAPAIDYVHQALYGSPSQPMTAAPSTDASKGSALPYPLPRESLYPPATHCCWPEHMKRQAKEYAQRCFECCIDPSR